MNVLLYFLFLNKLRKAIYLSKALMTSSAIKAFISFNSCSRFKGIGFATNWISRTRSIFPECFRYEAVRSVQPSINFRRGLPIINANSWLESPLFDFIINASRQEHSFLDYSLLSGVIIPFISSTSWLKYTLALFIFCKV